VGYSTNKDDVQCARIPISELLLNTSGIDIASTTDTNFKIEGPVLCIMPGVYMAKIRTKDGIQTKKFVLK
jgi:hypothetical protein